VILKARLRDSSKFFAVVAGFLPKTNVVLLFVMPQCLPCIRNKWDFASLFLQINLDVKSYEGPRE